MRLFSGLAALLLVCTGCQTIAPSGSSGNTNDNTDPVVTDYTDGNLDPSASSPNGKVRGEPNDTLATSMVAVFDSSDKASLVGTVQNSDDADVFALGSLEEGDRVIVDMGTPDSSLDVCITILDEDELIFAWNDDEDLDRSLYDSYIDEIIRHDSDYYLVIYAAAYAEDADQQRGTYTATVRIERGGAAPLPIRQRLLLDFDGVSSTPASIPLDSVPAFDASAISQLYAGQNGTIKQAIISTVEENYDGLGVDIYTTDDASLPAEPYTSVVLGGLYPGAYGIAEDVDLYNSDLSQMAVIFTESFAPRQFSSVPSASEMGVAIGNVATHESGHLLGLHHVIDSKAIMDEVSPADALLEDQDFIEAPLSSNISPLGLQDAFQLLREIVGLE